MTYDDAVRELYQAPNANFVAERKRLATALKAAGDAAAAARLAKLARPPISVWVVNQLWWQKRKAFEGVFATAKRLQHGDRKAQDAHREGTTQLRAHAAEILEQAGHAASEPTLRRVAATIAALAASGSFDPDPPGALSADRDPPGFEAFGIGNALPDAHASEADDSTAAPAHGAKQRTSAATKKLDASVQSERESVAEREREAAARREREARAADERREKEKRQAERRAQQRKLESKLHDAKKTLDARTRQLELKRREFAEAEASFKRAEESLRELEKALNDLESDD